ncbi:MAG: transcription antitermination factor NusB [Desulfobacteraceae bacterium]|nr:transcription antitermination factor NusB [Desulfobacteraceae bacterium]
MGLRRQARELTMQTLFSMDMNSRFTQQALEEYVDCFPPDKNVLPFFLRLVGGVLDNKKRLDTIIESHSSNWKIHRMACVDRNVLRVAIFELVFCGDIPCKVSINEGIDIGKKYGSPESGAFINGILDSVNIAINKGSLETFPEPPNLKITEAMAGRMECAQGDFLI